MRILLFTLMSLASAALLAGPVYKWVDENGVVHYSDQPHANAEKISVAAPQTFKGSQAAPAAPAAGGDTATDTAQPAYIGCAIGQPDDGAELTNVESLSISVQANPGLRPGDQVFITIDGSAVNGGQPTGPSYTVSPVERGMHTAQAVIRDSRGAVQCQTQTVTFNVHQPSIQNPVNPVRPH